MKADKEGYSVTTVRRSRMAAYKGRTIRKVMGGVEKKKEKKSCKGKCKAKNSCKEECKEKKFVQKVGPAPGPAI